MNYFIDRNEQGALPRIVRERIELAQAQLTDSSEPPEERVHNARKRLKEARAAVRLIREPLGKHFAMENASLRDIGRGLATLRDTDAVIEAARKLEDVADGFHERRVLRSAMRRLRHVQRQRRKSEWTDQVDIALQQLVVVRARVTMWPDLGDGFEIIEQGLKRTYRDGRDALGRAAKSPAPRTLHEWRKRVKDHWYHAQILRHIDPVVMKVYRQQMEVLSDALGDRHDLDVLREIARDARPSSPRDLKILESIIDRRSDELTSTAFAVGRVIYDDKPGALVETFRTLWETWERPET